MTSKTELLQFVVQEVQKRQPLGQSSDEQFLNSLFQGSATLSGTEQLEIYRQQFWLRHERALEDDFPGLARLMGESWEKLVVDYLEATPSHSFTLRNLGAALVSFLETHHPGERLWLDMARLEWAYIEAFDADDPTPLSPTALLELSETDWQSATLELCPSLRLLTLDYPVHEYRRSLRKGETLSPELGRSHLLVYRHQDLSVYDKRLDPAAFQLLTLLHDGRSLSEACDEVATDPDRIATLEQELGNWFRTFGDLGLIARVTPRQAVTSNG